MMTGVTSVRVVVMREVLQEIAGTSADRAATIAKFNAYRRQFEAIASDKFDRGETRPIEVTRADVIKFAADGRPEAPSA